MTALIITVFVASLLGSLHCAGMCGPLVALALGAGEPDSPSRTRLQLLYHGGRLVTYALVGVIFGAIGTMIQSGGTLLGVQRAAAVAAGIMMVIFGVGMLLRVKGVHVPKMPMSATLQKALMTAQRYAMRLSPNRRALTIGLLTALLPCGWLYAFAITAAGTASPLGGGLTMIAFWAGTVPVLAALGAGLAGLSRVLGPKLPVITSVAIVAVGLYTATSRLTMTSKAWAKPLPTAAVSTEQAIEQVHSIGKKTPPCCEGHDAHAE